MARPQKSGIDYFPLDVDMDQDDKVLLIEAKHKITGFAVLMKLLMKIYKEGYFYKWTEREQLLFSSRISVDTDLVIDIVNDCIKWDLFSPNMYRKYSILTSSGIQKRYIEAISRRKEITLIAEYLVIEIPESSDKLTVNIVNVHINPENVHINPAQPELMCTLIPKVKDSTVNNTKSNKTTDSSVDSFEEFWKLYPKKIAKTSALKCWKTLIKNGASIDDLITASQNYAIAMNGKDQQFILQASTFLGPQKRYEDFIKGVGNSGTTKNNLGAIASGEAEADEEWPITNSFTR